MTGRRPRELGVRHIVTKRQLRPAIVRVADLALESGEWIADTRVLDADIGVQLRAVPA